MTSIFDEPRRDVPAGPRWFVGVPVGTNPLFLLDFATVLAVAWIVSWGMLLGLQKIFSGTVNSSNMSDAARVASYLSVVFIAIFLIVSFGILRNRYAALFRFDGTEAYCESMRCYPRPLDGRTLRFRPYGIEPLPEMIRSVERSIPWQDVKKIIPMADMGILILKGRRGTLMRVYCPDSETFRQAWEFASSCIARR